MYDYEKIKSNLSTKYVGQVFVQFEDLSSVHAKAKNISETCPSGMLVLCEKQEDIKLKNNKAWQSKSIDGVFMSIILKDIKSLDYSSQMIQIATASVCEAILLLDDAIDCHIKWPNDIYLYDKKVCSVFSEKIDKKDNDSLIITIYLNVSKTSDDLNYEEAIIGSISDVIKKEISKEEIISNILNKIETYYDELIKSKELRSSLETFKYHNHIIGKELGYRLINKKTIKKAKAVDINSLGEIVIINNSSGKENKEEEGLLKYGRDTIEWCVDEWVED
jgi:BirA family biotin operon repressor/biotin-[acetyl-CoA-carboxylase] ligase